MRIVFDPDFACGSWPGSLRGGIASAGEDWVGAERFVEILETALGIAPPRLSLAERAARLVPAVRGTDGFWSASAEVDPFGTARRLLEWRDALAMGGWRGAGLEPRLAALGALTADAAAGLPDRLQAVGELIPRRDPGIESVELLTPRTDFEPLWQRALAALEERGTRILETELAPASAPPGSDLAAARERGFKPRGDGSLRLLRPGGPLAAAEEVAAWLASLPMGATTLVVGSDPVLDAALHRHGLPTAGAMPDVRESAPLQILPLVLDLAWTPVDPQRAYELLSLRSSPVPGPVRWGLREALKEWPAVDSDAWREALAEGLTAIQDAEARSRAKQRLDVLWDARLPRGSDYPVAEVQRRTDMLRTWLARRVATAGDDAGEWRVAAAQCEEFIELVRRSGLTALSAAQLRRLVIEATHGSPAGAPFPAEAGTHLVGSPGGVAGPVAHVVWWRFDEASAAGVPRLPLTRAERAELEARGVTLPDPGRIMAAAARRWRRPLDQAAATLLLVCPERNAAGDELHPHPLWDEIVARVAEKNTRRVAEAALLRASLAVYLPQTRRELLPLPEPRRSWTLPAGSIVTPEKHSPTGLETLFGCPLRWALRNVGRIYGADAARLEDGTSVTLLGRLLHAILNLLFAGQGRTPEGAGREAGEIFDREGPRLVAALFLPGADTLRARVRRVAEETAQALHALMQARGVHVVATEESRAAAALGTKLEGRVDLVLGDPPRILDLKWGGAGRKRDSLAAGTAFQLAAYAYLMRADRGAFPPVGYYIMDGQRLLTTEPDSFHDAEFVDGPPPGETWRVLEANYGAEWREIVEGHLAARGIQLDDDEKLPEKARVVDGRFVLPAPCEWCEYGALCGRAFGEAE